MIASLSSGVRKKYLLISALSKGWHTIEQLEKLTDQSRSQVFRNFKKLKSEYMIQIYSQPRGGEDPVMIYRITDMGIINSDRFELFMSSDRNNEVG